MTCQIIVYFSLILKGQSSDFFSFYIIGFILLPGATFLAGTVGFFKEFVATFWLLSMTN